LGVDAKVSEVLAELAGSDPLKASGFLSVLSHGGSMKVALVVWFTFAVTWAQMTQSRRVLRAMWAVTIVVIVAAGLIL
jgi:hypothetical protein